MTETHRIQLREQTDQITRYVQDLESARDRASVTQDEIIQRLAEQMNRTMMVLRCGLSPGRGLQMLR